MAQLQYKVHIVVAQIKMFLGMLAVWMEMLVSWYTTLDFGQKYLNNLGTGAWYSTQTWYRDSELPRGYTLITLVVLKCHKQVKVFTNGWMDWLIYDTQIIYLTNNPLSLSLLPPPCCSGCYVSYSYRHSCSPQDELQWHWCSLYF